MNDNLRTISQIADRIEELTDALTSAGIHIVKRTDGEKPVYAVTDNGTTLYRTSALERAAAFARYLRGGSVDADEWQTLKADFIGQRLKAKRSSTQAET